MSNPTDGATVAPDSLNTQGYLQVTFADIGDGLDAGSINGDEISVSGSGTGSAVLNGTATLVSSTTFRYGFSGAFVDGGVNVQLVAGSFQDLADTPNLNVSDQLELYRRYARHDGSDRFAYQSGLTVRR